MKAKKRIATIALTAVMIIGAALPASAATAKYTFTKSGNVYGITTSCTGFSSYVTAGAKVTNNGKYTQKSTRGYKSASATASRTCTSGTVTRDGWYTT